MNLFGMKTNNSDDAIMNESNKQLVVLKKQLIEYEIHKLEIESNINLIKDKISYYNGIVSKLNGINGAETSGCIGNTNISNIVIKDDVVKIECV